MNIRLSHDEAIERCIECLREDPAKLAEADSNWSGTLDDEYAQMESALADLHEKQPADLLGSDLLTQLYRLAKVCAEKRSAALLDMALLEIECARQDEAEAASDAQRDAQADGFY